MVTWANFHYLDFTMNWVQHVQAANISAYLVGAMDDELLQALVNRGVNCFGMQSGLSTEDFGWGSKQFHKMVCSPDGHPLQACMHDPLSTDTAVESAICKCGAFSDQAW